MQDLTQPAHRVHVIFGSCNDADGKPISNVSIYTPRGITVGKDSNVYFCEAGPTAQPGWVRRVDPDGIMWTVAGGGTLDPTLSEGILGTEARLSGPHDVAVGPDGTVYFTDYGYERVFMVTPNGRIFTLAGGGTSRENGIDARQLDLWYPLSVAVGPDGSVYITDQGSPNKVWRISPEGKAYQIAGSDTMNSLLLGNIDGMDAMDVYLSVQIRDVEVDSFGNVYLAVLYPNNAILHRVLVITTDGKIYTVAGGGLPLDMLADGGPPRLAQFSFPTGIGLAPDGSLLIADQRHARVRRINDVISPYSIGSVVVPSEDGSQIYQFDMHGRHQTTRDALTGALIYSFFYTPEGYLDRVEDAYGNVTSVERGADGEPLAIVAPDGQRTEFTLDANGYLDTVTNPAGEVHDFDFTPDGLMDAYTDPKSGFHDFEFDELGKLVTDQDPTGSTVTLNQTKTEDGRAITFTTEMGRQTRYEVESGPLGIRGTINTFPSGHVNQSWTGADQVENVFFADGTIVTKRPGPDPRWGMKAPITKTLEVSTPSGLHSVQQVERQATLLDEDDPLSFTELLEATDINGRVYNSVFEAASRIQTVTSPEGRLTETMLDEQGRVVGYQVDGLAPVSFGYDARGRLDSMVDGEGVDARAYGITYDADGFVDTITDPLGRTVSFDYDDAGRVTRQELPDGREVFYAYDEHGNVRFVTPPGRPSHEFTYDAVDSQKNYIPPDVGAGMNLTHYDYNPDHQLELVTRPDGLTIDPAYDSAGRLDTVTIPRGTIDLGYSIDTGQLESIATPEGNVVFYGWDGMLMTATQWVGEVAGTVERTYDNDFRLDTLTVNGSQTVAYGYDQDSLLTQAGSMTLTRDPLHGLITDTTLGLVTTNQVPNQFGELQDYTAKVSGSDVYSVHYDRDALGRIHFKTETIQGVTVQFEYIYDLAGRLDQVYRDGILVSDYDYGLNSNRVAYTDEFGVMVTGTYDDQDRMLSYAGATYTYTDNGELATKTEGGQTWGYTYDVLGNLTRVVKPDGTVIEYVIDGRNRRVGKKVDGVLVQGFLYADQLNPIAELDGAGNVVSLFVYGSRANVPEYMVRAGVTYRIVSDHLGSPRLVVDVATGAVAQRIDYDEFGRVLADSNPGFQPFGFAGGLWDGDVGLVRFGARDFYPHAGRWTVKDPIVFASVALNLYGYAVGDPINWTDLFGLAEAPWSIEDCKRWDKAYRKRIKDSGKENPCYGYTPHADSLLGDCIDVVNNWDKWDWTRKSSKQKKNPSGDEVLAWWLYKNYTGIKKGAKEQLKKKYPGEDIDKLMDLWKEKTLNDFSKWLEDRGVRSGGSHGG